MLSTQVNMAMFGMSDAAIEFETVRERNCAGQKSQYATLLQAPMSSLASSANDGADVYSAAILGYN
ncbi:hypothetical protein [Paraburkholderia phenoliruptrix]|uniref:Uncharacterized protein n=2 Tax=Paraburkholderia phenoliruptrix TaxID=252970 RepID=A0A6J5KHC0_9BURK|nr:hypothetical protein [Paraburkholderia phenoliruptrix]CAB4053017.1 hypothetical protein LMG9964_06708 [Paraburkholderia phenoliruptrix]